MNLNTVRNKIKYNLIFIENDTAWFESEVDQQTFNLPSTYSEKGKTFVFSKNSEVLLCQDKEEDQEWYIISKEGSLALVVCLTITDDLYEITGCMLFELHTMH